MHIKRIRTKHPRNWRRFNLIALLAIIAECSLWWLAAPPAAADASESASGRIAVRTVRAAALDSYAATRTYAGQVVAGRSSQLGFKFAGTLAAVTVDIGATVSAGELLAELDTASREAALAQARAGVRVARANTAAAAAQTELAAQTEQRFANLRQAGHVSEQEYDQQRLTLQAQQAQQQVAEASQTRARAAQRAAEVDLQDARIRAPYSGVIQARYADEGTQVNPGQPVLRLVEEQNKEAHVGLPASLATTLTPGTTHTLLWSGQRLEATLSTVLPEIDASNRTVTAVYRLAGETSSTPPIGAVIELTLASEVAGAGFWVPLTALTESERGLWGVYVVNAEQILERRLVEIMHSDSERAFVRGTLRADDQIVATGIQRLVPGQQVTAVPIARRT